MLQKETSNMDINGSIQTLYWRDSQNYRHSRMYSHLVIYP